MEMSDMVLFQKAELGRVRCFVIDDEPWFLAKDVCECLGLSNTTVATSKLDEDEVTKLNLGGQSGEVNLVNESGIYNLVLGSRKPEAKAFKRWITHDVIPSIRKRGVYATPEAVSEMSAEELMAKAIIAANETIERIKLERDEAIRTKAQISAGREASIMGRLGSEVKKNKVLTKENQELKDKLGESQNFYTVASIPWILKYMTHDPYRGELKCDVFNRVGTALSRICKERGINLSDSNKILNKEGKRVNVYPASVVDWLEKVVVSKNEAEFYYRFLSDYMRPKYRA
jgi:prophage antirepressor-like protein